MLTCLSRQYSPDVLAELNQNSPHPEEPSSCFQKDFFRRVLCPIMGREVFQCNESMLA